MGNEQEILGGMQDMPENTDNIPAVCEDTETPVNNEDIGIAAETETPDETEILRARVAELQGRLICAELGIPKELCGDILAAANASADGGTLEDTVKAVYERFVKAASATCDVRTGVRTSRGADDRDSRLRRAFGLKG